jgi:hypothetical protein
MPERTASSGSAAVLHEGAPPNAERRLTCETDRALIHAEPGMARALIASSTEVLAGLVDRVTFHKRRASFPRSACIGIALTRERPKVCRLSAGGLEGDGFEPSVPQKKVTSRWTTAWVTLRRASPPRSRGGDGELRCRWMGLLMTAVNHFRYNAGGEGPLAGRNEGLYRHRSGGRCAAESELARL